MKKQNIKLSLFIALTVVFSLSVTYAYIFLTATDTSETNQGGCFEVYYSGQAINNSALQSTTDYTQGATSDIILSKDSSCKIYTEASINIHTDSTLTDAPLETGALKYKIMQGDTEISSGSINEPTTEDQTLATVELTNTQTTYTVYLWIDSSISLGTFNGKNYSGYFYASSTQSSTVTGA